MHKHGEQSFVNMAQHLLIKHIILTMLDKYDVSIQMTLIMINLTAGQIHHYEKAVESAHKIYHGGQYIISHDET